MVNERFTIEVEALAQWGVPADVRLKRFLKCALRGFGLRCVAVANLIEGRPNDEPEVAGRKDG